jgi:hypothetical protein
MLSMELAGIELGGMAAAETARPRVGSLTRFSCCHVET